MSNETKTHEAKLVARRIYMRNWRKANPEKTKKHRDTFWERRAKQLTEALLAQGEGANA